MILTEQATLASLMHNMLLGRETAPCAYSFTPVMRDPSDLMELAQLPRAIQGDPKKT